MRRPIWLTSVLLALTVQTSGLSAQTADTTDENTPEQAPTEAQTEVLTASVPTRAERQEDALRRQLPTEQLRQLEVGDDAFLGLFLPAAQPNPLGGILLIADRDEHADWPELIGPARRQLSEQGWHTLAISLPDDPASNLFLEEAARAETLAATSERIDKRINAAAQALNAEGATTLVLLGRGEGAYWALHATGAQASPRVEAAALVLYQTRAPAAAQNGEAETAAWLSQWSKPAYEVFAATQQGSQELARQRSLGAQRHGRDLYAQLVLSKPDPSPLGQSVLIKRLQGWLEKHLPPQQP